MGKQAKDEGGRYLVRRVRDAGIKVGHVDLDEIANDNIQLVLLGPDTNYQGTSASGGYETLTFLERVLRPLQPFEDPSPLLLHFSLFREF